MQRKYFVSIKQVAAYLDVTERTIRNWCEAGWCNAEQYGPETGPDGRKKKHRPWRIPTEELRRVHRALPVEFWAEVVEDAYKGLDGLKSAEMRLERRRQGRDPTTGRQL